MLRTCVLLTFLFGCFHLALAHECEIISRNIDMIDIDEKSPFIFGSPLPLHEGNWTFYIQICKPINVDLHDLTFCEVPNCYGYLVNRKTEACIPLSRSHYTSHIRRNYELSNYITGPDQGVSIRYPVSQSGYGMRVDFNCNQKQTNPLLKFRRVSTLESPHNMSRVDYYEFVGSTNHACPLSDDNRISIIVTASVIGSLASLLVVAVIIKIIFNICYVKYWRKYDEEQQRILDRCSEIAPPVVYEE
ncbi:hypothetical protein AKO1_002512 [Acrasis kona]|uniref:Uncharacterized protein n=1 Tax=Acrasis kona TaxID=1008807 RepID=A0AAW2ZQ38_9EUKA